MRRQNNTSLFEGETAVTKADSLLGRAVIALALTAGFYVLALATVAVLLFVPYQLWAATGRVSAQLTIFCLVSAILILYSIAPRIDRFVEPGPKLTETEHPQLFRFLRRVADSTSQKMPSDVYLVPDLNAWVANRGGFLGIGSRRVMGLGLPTFQALTVSQFVAVIAHEFGHYHHGDVALGPWLYRVRQGIGRTLQTLEERNNILLIPFSWYGHLFLRVTTAISRRQEFGADALAARVAGSDSLASGLEVIHASAPVFDGYWGTEVMPVLLSGKRPPINEGFRRFSEAPRIQDAASTMLKAAMDAAEDPFDTHPPLARRLAALQGLPTERTLDLTSTDRATTLLGDVDRTEAALLHHLIEDEGSRPQESIAWAEVGREIWIPIWRQRIEEAGERLKGSGAPMPAQLRLIRRISPFAWALPRARA